MTFRSVFLILSLFGGYACAGGSSEAANALRSIVKEEFDVLAETTGDLNEDGQEDWIGIIKIERPAGTVQRLYVLTRNNGLNFAAASKEASYTDCGGNCWTELWIEKGSFFVSQSDKGGWGNINATTQFKLYKNQWRAIGQKTYRIDREKDEDFETDSNLLTGAYMTASTVGSGSGNPKPTKRKRGVGKPGLLLLKDLDLGQI